MKAKVLATSAIGCVLLFNGMAYAQGQSARAGNAALRYWMAFAMLREPTSDRATSELLERVVNGQASWDEERLGKVLDANAAAMDLLTRGTALGTCDWGLEYALGPSTPIAHLPKARVLGRLATLAGLRAAARGRTQEAVDLWLSGIRFSMHVAQGDSLISVLSARAILGANMRALGQAASAMRMDARESGRIATAIRSLPLTAFDWGAAIRREADSIDVMIRQLAGSPDPAAAYRRMVGVDAPSPFVLPTSGQMQSYRALMDDVATTLQMPPAAARGRLSSHEQARLALHPLLRDSIPSLTRVNDTRAEIEAERQRLLSGIGQVR